MKLSEMAPRGHRNWDLQETVGELARYGCSGCGPRPMETKAKDLVGKIVEIPVLCRLRGHDTDGDYLDRVRIEVMTLTKNGRLLGVVRSDALPHSYGPWEGDEVSFDADRVERILPEVHPTEETPAPHPA